MGLARLEAHHALAAPKRVRGAGHRLDRKAAPRDVRQGIATEDHHVREALIGPEGRPDAELDADAAVVVPFQVGEAVIEPHRAYRLRLAEVALGSGDRLAVDRKRAL